MGAASDVAVEYLDVLIVGAGISGIGCAYYLQRDLPQKRYAILEARADSGGTWDLFRYPGIRSDSDLHTFGYEFEPWESDRAIAGGDEILAYIRATAARHGIDRQIRPHHRVVSADWNSAEAGWRVEVERTDTGETLRFSCSWLFAGTGYYRYDEGYTPALPGIENFRGQVVHPQHWPAGLDYAGKRVVVIGSGATAVTLVPAMSPTAAHVTMLQRSPSYILSQPTEDTINRWLKRLLAPPLAYRLTRSKNVFLQTAVYKLSRRFPKLMRGLIRRLTARQLPECYPVDVDFNPRYGPWDQRLCIVPDGDLFRAMRHGDASVVTDTIVGFSAGAVQLASRRELPADIVVTATGLNLRAFGDIAVAVDGEPVQMPDTLAFRGMMLSGLPNFAFLIGYTNASWTLKVGPVGRHFVRMLRYMDEHGYDAVVPVRPAGAAATRPLLNFSAGYVQRSIDRLPRQGTEAPWELAMDFATDKRRLGGPVEDPNLRFSRLREPVAESAPASGQRQLQVLLQPHDPVGRGADPA